MNPMGHDRCMNLKLREMSGLPIFWTMYCISGADPAHNMSDCLVMAGLELQLNGPNAIEKSDYEWWLVTAKQ